MIFWLIILALVFVFLLLNFLKVISNKNFWSCWEKQGKSFKESVMDFVNHNSQNFAAFAYMIIPTILISIIIYFSVFV